MSLLKVKVISKCESKLYNYNKIVCTNINSKLLFIPLLIYYLCYWLYKILPMICVTMYMHDGSDKNTKLQIHNSIKYISNTHEGVMKNEIYCN